MKFTSYAITALFAVNAPSRTHSFAMKMSMSSSYLDSLSIANPSIVTNTDIPSTITTIPSTNDNYNYNDKDPFLATTTIVGETSPKTTTITFEEMTMSPNNNNNNNNNNGDSNRPPTENQSKSPRTTTTIPTPTVKDVTKSRTQRIMETTSMNGQ